MILTPEGKDKLLAMGTICVLVYVMYAVVGLYITKPKGPEVTGKVVYTNNTHR